VPHRKGKNSAYHAKKKSLRYGEEDSSDLFSFCTKLRGIVGGFVWVERNDKTKQPNVQFILTREFVSQSSERLHQEIFDKKKGVLSTGPEEGEGNLVARSGKIGGSG